MSSKTQRSADSRISPISLADSTLLALRAELLAKAAAAEAPEDFVGWAVSALGAALGASCAALVSAASGRWTTIAEWNAAGEIPRCPQPSPPAPLPKGEGRRGPLPITLLAEALDRETARADAGWIAVPLAPRSADGEVLAVYVESARPAPQAPLAKGEATEGAIAVVARIAPVLHQALAAVRRRAAVERRLRRLEAVLAIAAQWNQARELEPLLVQMAEAATRLLGTDRASIFLWDRPNRVLVGRPALGLPEGELRLPDDRGVVGEVIHSGRPRRVDAASEPKAVDRKVDQQLHYETRTLLCVPLRGRDGELLGAFELINKRCGPFTQEDEEALVELAAHAAVALENAQDRRQLLTANRRIAQQASEKVQLVGESPAIEALRSIVRRVADTDLAVLILGENGTGKEVVAQSIHYLSRRRDQPFIAVNCAAIPETLAESELFGHEKGAFTDAREARAGKFELAAGGTLFLDEIGELSLGCQAKLLRVIEEKTLVRVGGSTPIHTDARLLAATNQNLAEMVRAKRFREDLYFRLNVVAIDLPPLRERGNDVLLLAEHFLGDFCRRARRKTPQLTAAARKRLLEHLWPGNIRELRNLMERLAYLSTEDRIDADDLAFILSPRGQKPLVADLDQSLLDATTRFQTEYIRRQIELSGGNMSLAAGRLGLHRSNLYRKMRQLGMET
jgi:transcriptional regulator with GAF, ATPase, and Fis domain